MNHKVLVFPELFEQLPRVRAFFEEEKLEAVLGSDWKNVFQVLKDCQCSAILLDVSLPMKSGLEICRQIKERESLRFLKVILVASKVTDFIEEQAQLSGCDLFVQKDSCEEKIIDFLKILLSSPSEFLGRDSLRTEVTGKVFYFEGTQIKPGELLNISRSGILFAAEKSITVNTRMTLRLDGPEKNPFDLTIVVARCIHLKTPRGQFLYGIGAKFFNVTETQKNNITWVTKNHSKTTPTLTLDGFREILEKPEKVLSFVLETNLRTPLTPYMQDILPFEKDLIQGTGKAADCTARVVALRTQCNAAIAFVPLISIDRKNLGHIYLPMLSGLLQRSDAIEGEVEEIIRHATSENREADAQALLESVNRLTKAKVKLIFSLDEGFQREGMSLSEIETLDQIHERAILIHNSTRKKNKKNQYDHNKIAEEIQEKSEAKRKKILGLPPPAFMIILLFFFSGLIAWVVLARFERTVTPEELKVPLKIDRATIKEKGLTIIADSDSWRRLSKKDKDLVLQRIEVYLREKSLQPTWLKDNMGKDLASISSKGPKGPKDHDKQISFIRQILR